MSEQAEPGEKTSAMDVYLQELVSIVLTEARRRRTFAYPITAILVGLSFWLLFLAVLQPGSTPSVAKIVFLSTIYLVPVAIFVGLSKLPTKRVRDAVLDIANIDSPEAIQELLALDAYIFDRIARDQRNRTIRNWLLGMNAEKATGVPQSLRVRVRKMITDPSSQQINETRSGWICAWLHAIEFIGDAKVLPVVQRCCKFRSKRPYVVAVREKAQDVLPRLEARLAVEAQQSSLLRAVDAPVSDALLRPAGTSASAEATLVRPALLNTQAAE
jgi:hypothetical protein